MVRSADVGNSLLFPCFHVSREMLNCRLQISELQRCLTGNLLILLGRGDSLFYSLPRWFYDTEQIRKLLRG
jgi:hypothetical protein